MPVLAALSMGAVTFAAGALAQQANFEPLAQFGVMGIVMAALARFAQTTVARQAKELDEERAYSRSLSERIETQIIPTALRLAEVADRMTRYMESRP